MKKFLTLLLATGLFVGCSAKAQKSKSLVPTGLETAKSASERTRKTQESDETGAIYASSAADEADETDEDAAAAPKADVASEETTITKGTHLRVSHTGEVSAGDRVLDAAELQNFFSQLPDDEEVTVHALASTPHERIVNILDEAKKAGITRVSIVTDEEPESQPDPQVDALEPTPTKAAPAKKNPEKDGTEPK